MIPKNPHEIIQTMIPSQGSFPGNPHFPLLIYKKVFISSEPPSEIQALLKKNLWGDSWVDSIYPFHHYHARTHEVLVMISGSCKVKFGGEQR